MLLCNLDVVEDFFVTYWIFFFLYWRRNTCLVIYMSLPYNENMYTFHYVECTASYFTTLYRWFVILT